MVAESQSKTAGKDVTRAYLALFAGILCIGAGPMFVKFASRTVASEVIAFYRLLIAALALTIPVLLRLKTGASIDRKSLPIALLAGVFFGVNIGMWNFALTMTSAANVTLLDNTAPVWVGLGTLILLKRKLPFTYWLGLALALLGAVLIIRGGGNTAVSANTLPGDLLALAAGVIYAFYLLAAERARKTLDNLTFVWLFSSVGALLMLAFALFRGSPLVGFPAEAIAALLALGLLTHLGGWLLINYALGILPASTVSVMLLGQPVVTTLLAIPLYNEIPGGSGLLGGVVTLIGIGVVLKGNSRDE